EERRRWTINPSHLSAGAAVMALFVALALTAWLNDSGPTGGAVDSLPLNRTPILTTTTAVAPPLVPVRTGGSESITITTPVHPTATVWTGITVTTVQTSGPPTTTSGPPTR